LDDIIILKGMVCNECNDVRVSESCTGSCTFESVDESNTLAMMNEGNGYEQPMIKEIAMIVLILML
jgi:hypothetical protein